MITIALSSIAGWVGELTEKDIPVLAETATELAALAEDPDFVSAGQLAAVILRDPLMTVRVFATLTRMRGDRPPSNITKIEGCIAMIGMAPFLESIASMPTIEGHLADRSAALDGLMRVVRRARTAARVSRDFAVWRKDSDAEELAIAALLHDISELLVFTYAPDLALEMREAQAADPQHRSARAQEAVLHVNLLDVQQALVRTWGLPEMLVSVMNDRSQGDRRVRNVALAVRIARHAQGGWGTPTLMADYAEAAQLLMATPDRVRQLVETPDRNTDDEHNEARAWECTMVSRSPLR